MFLINLKQIRVFFKKICFMAPTKTKVQRWFSGSLFIDHFFRKNSFFCFIYDPQLQSWAHIPPRSTEFCHNLLKQLFLLINGPLKLTGLVHWLLVTGEVSLLGSAPHPGVWPSVPTKVLKPSAHTCSMWGGPGLCESEASQRNIFSCFWPGS